MNKLQFQTLNGVNERLLAAAAEKQSIGDQSEQLQECNTNTNTNTSMLLLDLSNSNVTNVLPLLPLQLHSNSNCTAASDDCKGWFGCLNCCYFIIFVTPLICSEIITNRFWMFLVQSLLLYFSFWKKITMKFSATAIQRIVNRVFYNVKSYKNTTIF